MKPKTRMIYLLTALALCLALVGFTPWGQDLTPAITTDKPDYAPGETVTLTGVNFLAGQAVHIFVNDDIGQTWSHNSNPDPVVGENGQFTYQFQLPVWFVANYSVAASTGGKVVATTTFTDANIGTYDQCSNDLGTGYTSGDTGCRWINGNLQSNNSRYLEGDATVQRLWLNDMAAGSTHTVTFQYGTTKGGKHAYDFLTTWDWSEDWITVADRCQGIDGCETAGETTYPIPVDPNAGGFDAAAGSRLFTMRGGTITNVSTPMLVSGSYGADSDTQITITYTVDSSSSMCSTKQGVTTCGVAVWFGAHVSAQANWGLGMGAGSISGSPYHVALSATDGASVGQRDNQMQAGVVTAVPNGTIIIVKDAVPNDAQDFNFKLTNGIGTDPGTITQYFALDDDSDITLPNSQTFSVPPGAWTASELGLPLTGWDLTNLVCVDPTSNTTVDLGAGTASINLASNETVTCTYTNTKRGTIIINKTAVGGDATFGYSTTGGNGLPASFNITTSGGSGSQTYTNIVPGAYSVAETSLPGWTLSASSCSSGTPGGFTLAAGGTVTCSFTNTRTYNQDLTVTKTAEAAFKRAYHWKIDKSVKDDRIEIAEGGKATFDYSVKVTPDGYTDSDWVVTGKITVSNPNAFAVSGVTVSDSINNGGTCSVTNGANVTVPAGGSAVLDYTCTYASAPSPAAGTNNATAAWSQGSYDTPHGSANGTASVDFASVTPSESNEAITVVDNKTSSGDYTLGSWHWKSGEHIFTYSLDLEGTGGTCVEYTNTAKILQTGQSDNQTVTVCAGKDLTVSKTAEGSFGRTYKWLIDKSVDDTRIEIAAGGTATFNYSVKVTPNGYTDSGYTLGGTITVANPNDWEDITLTGLTDTLNTGSTCVVTEAAPYVVPKSGSLTVHYTCTLTSGAATTNTATATWAKATYFTPTGTASNQAAVVFSLGGETNKAITVVDDKTDPANPVTLGTWNWADGEHIFTYALDKQGVGGQCTDYTNTAEISETGQKDSQKVSVCVGLDLTVTKTAAGSFDRAYLWSISKAADKTSVSIAAGGTATFNYTVTASQTGFTDSGWTLAGDITLSNPNAWEAVTLTSLTDAVDNGGTCNLAAGPYVVPAGGTKVVHYTCTYASASALSGSNTATASWDKAAYFTPSGSASGSTAFSLTQDLATNKTVTVTDSLGGTLGTLTATDAQPYASGTYAYSHSFAGVGGTCTSYDNTATITQTGQSAKVTVEVCVGLNLSVSKTAAGSFGRTYLWEISKNAAETTIKIASGGTATAHYTVIASQTGITDSGWTLSGTITVTNPNNWEDITLTGLADTVDNGGTCTITEAGPYVAPKSGSLVVHYTCAYASAPSSYSGTNTATATWAAAAAFTPAGSASGTSGFSLTQSGSTNKTIHVTDSLGGALGTLTAVDAAPFTTHTYTYTHNFAGVGGTCTTYDNTATITETKQSASDSVDVCVGLNLTVSKTAAGTFDRTYLWQISKAADKTTVKIAAGGAATFHYTVDVEQTGITDSGWKLSGVITITNPNDWEAITLTNLADAANGGTCAVDPGPYEVPAGKSLDVGYTCSWAVKPSSYTGTNTATTTWDKTAAFTPSNTASGSAGFTLAQLGSTYKTVHVTDSFAGDLGTVTATDATPFASASFTYDRTEAGVAGTCTSYDNTATITETGQSAGKTVTVCAGLDLTIAKTANGTFDRTYLWQISKAADKTIINIAAGGTATFNYTVNVNQTGFTDSGWMLNGKITLTNPNDWEDITLTSLTDVVDNGGTCVVAAGPYKVLKSGTLDVNYTCTYTAASALSGTNTATAGWNKATYFTPTGSASVNQPFTMQQVKANNQTVNVTDSLGGSLGSVTATDGMPYASASFTYSQSFAGVGGVCTDYDNTATITETGQSASQTVTVCVGQDLTVSKTAVPSFTRTWTWSITKDFDRSYNLFAGDTVTHDYKVTVNPTSADSEFKVVGAITITNPNQWEAVTVNVADAVDNGGACTVDLSEITVAAKSSANVGYTCTWAALPSSYTGTNTASITWDQDAFFTPSGSASGAAGFTFTNPKEINPVVKVDDDNLTGESWSANRAPGEWTYTKPFTCSTNPADYIGGKYSYSVLNTAKIVETGLTDTATVDVTCYWPQIELTKTGDTLSKIGDGVTYAFKLDNNTPTDAGLRALSCSISDPKIGFNKTVTLASGASDSSTKAFTIPSGATDPFPNTATVTCKPVAATTSVVGSTTFSVSDSSTWSTNLFQPAVEIVKTGPAYATSGDVITYTFAINNKSSSDSPELMLDSVSDNVLGDLKAAAAAAGCDNLVYNGTCTFTASYTVPDVGLQPQKITNVVTLHMHPAGFPNDITDTDDHTVTVAPRSQLTNTSYCPLSDNQFRLIYHPDTAFNIYKLQASNPGQFYFNGFYYGEAGSSFTMTLDVAYPFVTQQGAGNPIQVHDGFGLTSGGCYMPTPSMSGYTIATQAMTPTSSAGNQIITPEDYTKQQMGETTTVTVSGTVPASGMVYVTIHLDYGLKKTTGWKSAGTATINPVSGKTYPDLASQTLGVTIHGYEVYDFARTVGSDTAATSPASYNEVKKFAGFLGVITDKVTGQPMAGVQVRIFNPSGAQIANLYTDEDGFYMFAYKHTSKAATYTVKVPAYKLSTSVTVKANGFAAVDFEAATTTSSTSSGAR